MVDWHTYKIDRTYQVIKTLGDGLSGEVLLVSDKDGTKALKFLKKVQLNVSRAEGLANFKNEFEILKKLAHPNIARILDFGFDTQLQKYYFTSEFVAGGPLDKACEGKPPEVTEQLIIQILRALNYLHTRGVYHFDIKPQNILVEMKDGIPHSAKIIDFGLAGYTSPCKRVGTPAYMAPEVINRGVLDGRTDLYSLGVVIYKLLTGLNPMAGRDMKETLDNQLQLTAKPPSAINPEIPEYWDHILQRLLDKDPAKRHSQASLVIRDLNFLSNRNIEIETEDTKLSYLPTKGILIGRDEAWNVFSDVFSRSFMSNAPAECHLLVVEGAKGAGKTRFLSEVRYFSQVRNVPVYTLGQAREEAPAAEQFIVTVDAEDASTDDINTLVRELSRRRCLVVWATASAPSGWSNCTTARLGNFSGDELKRYIEAVTGLDNAPEKLVDAVFARTQGNPLFVTEIMKALLGKGAFYDASGKWDTTTFDDIVVDYDKLDIPVSVEDHLLGRFHGLKERRQALLVWLACRRGELSLDEIHRLAGGERDALTAELLALVEGDFIRKTSRECSYDFTNLLYQDVIAKSIPETQRKKCHDRLATLFSDDPDGIQNHLWHVGHGSDPLKAMSALRKLAEWHVARQDYVSAISVLEELCSSLAVGEQSGRFDHALRLAEIYIESHRSPERALDILQKLHTAETKERCKSGADAEILSIRGKLVLVYFRLNLLDKAAVLIKESLEALQHSPESTDALIFRNYLGSLKYKHGEVDEAEKIFLETDAVWNAKLNGEERLKVSNNLLLNVYNFKKKYRQVIEVCQKRLTLLKDHPQALLPIAKLYYAIGDACYRITAEGEDGVRADYTSLCRKSFQECEAITRKTGNMTLMYSAFIGLGNLHYEKGDVDEALRYYQRALAIARQDSQTLNAAITAMNMGNCHIRLDAWDDAYSYLIYALNTLENSADKPTQSWVYLVKCRKSLAEVYLHRAQYAKAHVMLSAIVEIIARKPYLKAYQFGQSFVRLKLYHAEQRPADFDVELKTATALAQAVNDRDELKAYLKEIGRPMPDVTRTASAKPAALLQGGKMHSENQPPQQGSDDLKKIIEINNFINSERDVSQLLKIVLNYALQLTRAELGFIILLEEDGSLKTAQSINASPEEEEKVSMSIVRMALESGEIVSSADAESDERFDASESIVLNELKSVLCLPIKSQNRCVGAFYLDNRYQTSVFENCNVGLLKAFCDQVGIALENAKLFGKLTTAQLQLENKLQETEEELAEVKNLLIEESGVFKTKYSYNNIISKSKEMQNVFKLLDKVTETGLAVFLHGQSGTGKELVAKALHYNNPVRGNKKFVAINCGAIPVNLMESELFGHKSGSFTGAVRDKKGMFEEANGGTLFLDEIGELPPELQVKLLRVLQEGEVQRIGENHAIKIDVRIVSASLKDIETLLKAGKFREDLFYRLCQMRINLPPLKERKDDIPMLAKHFVKKYCQQNKMEELIHIPPDFMKALLEYDWPGNIRELENLILVACALQDKNELHLAGLPDHYGIKHMGGARTAAMQMAGNPASVAGLSDVLIDEKNLYDPTKTWRDYEAIIIAKCYEAGERRKKPVADQLELSHSTVYKKIEELTLDDTSNPIYADTFVYDNRFTLRDYVRFVFKAALKHHDNHPYAAIRQLAVSQGYFYKIIKQGKDTAPEEEAVEVEAGK